ncbi:MAG TPA: cytochrome c3 family protein [Pyrinomonadaceae bacterium]|nr:cytochrome c3 family protein [Pyrinomonadaceae bacterium]
MRRAGLFRHIIDLRFITLIVVVSITTMISVYTRVASKEAGEETTAAEAAQGSGARRTTQRRRTQRRTPAAPRVDYSRFSHATKGHFENCNSCHLIPSFEKPDVADYPDHPACINCHRQQFFRGARPVICSNCHTVTGPRNEARFSFPKPNQRTQFSDIFPHANHIKTTMLSQFKKNMESRGNLQATCNYCHKETLNPVVPGAPNAAVRQATFMDTPTTHSSCFGCHWQKGVENREQPPLATECSGCHNNNAKSMFQTTALQTAITASPAVQTTQTKPPAANTNTEAAKLTPAMLQRRGLSPTHQTLLSLRVSAKFLHVINHTDAKADPHRTKLNDEKKQVSITCLSCHTAARKASTLEYMRQNPVQLMSCSTSACHTSIASGIDRKRSVFGELLERSKDPKFDCAYCHAPPISLNPEVPCGHYTTVLESAKKENEALEKAGKKPRTLTGIEKLIPARCAEKPKGGS